MLRELGIVGAVVLAFGVAGVGCSDEKGLKVKSWSPKEGPVHGGDPVTLYGHGFGEGGARTVDVYFGGNKARVLSMEDGTELQVSPPPGKQDQTVDIELVFADARRIKIPNAYKYIDSAALDVGALTGGSEGKGKRDKPKKEPDKK